MSSTATARTHWLMPATLRAQPHLKSRRCWPGCTTPNGLPAAKLHLCDRLPLPGMADLVLRDQADRPDGDLGQRQRPAERRDHRTRWPGAVTVGHRDVRQPGIAVSVT